MIGNGVIERTLGSCCSIPLLLCALIVSDGCKEKVDNGYHVIAYDGARKEWTLIDKDFDRDTYTYHRKRFVLACDSYQYNGGGFEHSPDACVLRVGDVFQTDVGHGSAQHVFIDPEMKSPGAGDMEFYLSREQGEAHEVQFFKIVKEEVLPDEK